MIAYLFFAGILLAGAIAVMTSLFLAYRRGLAIRLGFSIVFCIVVCCQLSFFLGKEGITIVTGPAALATALIIIIPVLIWMFRRMITPLRALSENIAESSTVVNTVAESISQGTTEQAASAEEASASMEQIAANIRQNADNALQTEKIAIKAAENARTSGEAVVQTLKAMREIAQKTAVIESIASQTRMLSLNATIEATRAQEHGKAFSVVATEIRNLSDTTKTAASEINILVNASVVVAEKAGNMLGELVPSIAKTAELVQEISAASNEQSAGSAQINNAIQQLNQVIQQNAATSEEMAAVAKQLTGQGRQLRNLIEYFKVEKSARRRTQPSRAVEQNVPAYHTKLPPQSDIPNDDQDEEFERY